MRGRKLGEEVRGKAVERDVPEVEDACPAHRDVQAHGQEDVEHRVGRHPQHVLVGRDHRYEGDDGDEAREQHPLRNTCELPLRVPRDGRRSGKPALSPRDPFVDADLRS